MKPSTIAIILSFTASTLAAPYAKVGNTHAKRDAVTNCGTNKACITVAQAIDNWLGSVNTVNAFLNDPTQSAQTALDAASLEPGFLGTLSATSGLDAKGSAAAQNLMTFFPGVPALLNIAVKGESTFGGAAVTGINDLRCNQILTSIGDLWISAAAAVGADVPPRPAGPNVCPTFQG